VFSCQIDDSVWFSQVCGQAFKFIQSIAKCQWNLNCWNLFDKFEGAKLFDDADGNCCVNKQLLAVTLDFIVIFLAYN